MSEPPPIPLIERREIEARIVGPLLRAFAERFGEEPVRETARAVIEGLAREAGAELAERFGSNSLASFARALDLWKAGGALELQVLEQSDAVLDFDVVKCGYAELYRSLGLAELGATLSCCRDFSLVEGFNPDVELKRTHTIMEGASRCDFRFRTRETKNEG